MIKKKVNVLYLIVCDIAVSFSLTHAEKLVVEKRVEGIDNLR